MTATRRPHLFFAFLLHWITLVVIGWLAYALVRALWTIISFRVPAFDWLWYVPTILLLISLPLHLSLRFPRRVPDTEEPLRQRFLNHLPPSYMIYAGLFVLSLVSFDGLRQVIVLDPDTAPPIPISFWAYSDFSQAPDSLFRDFQGAHGRIYWDASNWLDGRQEKIAAGARRLASYGIDTYLMVPAPDFMSVPVYREWIANAHELARFIHDHDLQNVRGLIGDAEPPLHGSLDYAATDRSNFAQNVIALQSAIDELHRDYPELQIGVTATWLQYLDSLDGDSDLSTVMRSPVEPPGGWDFLNLMTYSSYFPEGWREYYVYLLERAMMQRYPQDRVSYLLGLVGRGMPGEGLLDYDDLVRDARLSRALGVREIVVYQLDGALEVFGSEFVRDLTHDVNGQEHGSTLRVPFSRPASMIFFGEAFADAVLDLRGNLAWGANVWVVISAAITRFLDKLFSPND